MFAIATSFSTYFCMYAFRKPFLAAKFEGQSFFGTDVELKTALVISQIIGYALSKYIGIKVCSEIQRGQRALFLVVLILAAEISLILYGAVPDQWKFLAIFLNGVPLGMVWGLVVWYLEGRRLSEILLAGLSCSFILASGVVKNIGQWLIFDHGISEGWMPAATGGLFLAPFLLSVLLLNQIPAPTQEDEEARTHRAPMDGKHRVTFVRHFFPGLCLLVIAYFFLTAYRDYRDNYQPELFRELGYQYEDVMVDADGEVRRVDLDDEARFFVDDVLKVVRRQNTAYLYDVGGQIVEEVRLRDDEQIVVDNDRGNIRVKTGDKTIITQAETVVMFGVTIPLGLLFLIRNNRWGLIGTYAIMISGVLLLAGSTWAYEMKLLSGFWWMTLVGLGAYMTYVPYGSVFFDRLIASTHVPGTAVFAIYVMDAIGYTGSVAVQIYRDVLYRGDADSGGSRLEFFIDFTYLTAAVGSIMLVSSCVYFLTRHQHHETE